MVRCNNYITRHVMHAELPELLDGTSLAHTTECTQLLSDDRAVAFLRSYYQLLSDGYLNCCPGGLLNIELTLPHA